MNDRIQFIWPEIVLFATTCIVMVVGLSRTLATRKLSAWIAGLGLAVAGVVALRFTPDADANLRAYAGQKLFPNFVAYFKVVTAFVGLLLLMLAAGTVDRDEERRIAGGGAFDPLRSNRAEFYAFFLFSLTGLMLCSTASDLVWLFLALELTSLPSYIMVAISSPRGRSQEAAVKYFFLGALGAAIFLFGFAFIYGGTGSTNLDRIAQVVSESGLNGLSTAGFVLALIGLGFKIAAVPMHFYTADVYQGAAAPVSAFLAYVPKTAGFIAILLLCGSVGWVHDGHAGLPPELRITLWVMAAMTMTVGNILALWQTSVKRMLAYSSIAHSGYMLVGVIAGPGDGNFSTSGVAAILFYLLGYGITSVGTFAAIAALERPTKHGVIEVESIDDLKGLCKTRPMLGWTMLICVLSLLGFPPLLGFFAKLPLFTAGIDAHEYVLVVVLGLNSAIAAWYYLGIARAVYLDPPEAASDEYQDVPFATRSYAGVIAAIAVVVLVGFGNFLTRLSLDAANYKLGQYPQFTPTKTGGTLPSFEDLRRMVPGTAVATPVEPAPAGDKPAK